MSAAEGVQIPPLQLKVLVKDANAGWLVVAESNPLAELRHFSQLFEKIEHFCRFRWRVTHSSSSNFTFKQPFLREFQDSIDLFARDGRKLFEKLIDTFGLDGSEPSQLHRLGQHFLSWRQEES